MKPTTATVPIVNAAENYKDSVYALVASFLFPKLGIAIGGGVVREIIHSAIGAILLLVVVRLVRRGGRF